MMNRGQGNVIVMRESMIQNYRYFQGQVNLDIAKVAGYYYNTHARVTFEKPTSTQAPDDETSS